MTQDRPIESLSPPVLSVPDLLEALDFFTTRLGFRIDMIFPADAPQTAIIAGQGITLRLEVNTNHSLNEAVYDPHELIISRADTNMWSEGRAGMQYRDLIPGRLGGRFIASHIRIPEGGETPDYVHYHKVRFQMIYCKAGWVRVVYEDQGPPFVLEAGDCVLQPPEIRHRVLASSPGLEVIEIGCPAIHETWADHALQLPTAQVLPARIFSGQRFVIHHAKTAQWQPSPCDGLEICDRGIAIATNNLAGVCVLRATGAIQLSQPAHSGELLFWFVLQGGLTLDGNHELQAGDSCVIPAGIDYSLQAKAGLELLAVSVPAELVTAKMQAY